MIMKEKVSRIAAFLLAASICLSLAGCGGNEIAPKTEQDEVKQAFNELDESDKKELEAAKKEMEAEMNGETVKEAAEPAAEAPAEDLGLKDPKYYTYLEDLAKSYAESDQGKAAGNYFYMMGVGDPVYANGKIYLSTKGSSKTVLYSYDIAGGSLEKAFEFTAGSDEEKYGYDCWYTNGEDLYLLYDKTVYGEDHIEKVSKDGSVENYDISGVNYANTIAYVFDNGKILTDVNGDDNMMLYDPASGSITDLNTIPVPSPEHAGVTQDAEKPVFMFAKGNSFYFVDTQSSMSNSFYIKDHTIYEYNTDTGEVTVFFKDDELLLHEKNNIKLVGDYLLISCKQSTKSMFSIVKMSDGSKIINEFNDFAPYLGGDGVHYKDYNTKKWYKIKYPDSTYTGKIEKAESLFESGEELAVDAADGHYVPIDDKYYVFYDDAGYFLRTYEKGSADEQLIIAKKQIDEDMNS